MDIQDLFMLGMKREIKDLLPTEGDQLELGPGPNPVCEEGLDLDKIDLNDPNVKLPYGARTLDVIHAYHVLEHLDTPVHLLAECQRVLKPGGHMNIVVPYYNSQLQCSCFEHKSFFSEEVWEHTFDKNCNKFGYEWFFDVHVNIIIGVVERNLCLMTQLVRL